MNCMILPSMIKGIILLLNLNYKEVNRRKILIQKMKKGERKKLRPFWTIIWKIRKRLCGTKNHFFIQTKCSSLEPPLNPKDLQSNSSTVRSTLRYHIYSYKIICFQKSGYKNSHFVTESNSRLSLFVPFSHPTKESI